MFVYGATGSGEKPKWPITGGGGSNYTEVHTNDERSGTDCPDVYIQTSNIYISNSINEISLVLNWLNKNKETTVIYGSDYVLEVLKDGQWVSCAVGNNLVFPQATYELKGEDLENAVYILTGFYNVNLDGTNLYRVTVTCTVRDCSGKEEQHSLWVEFTTKAMK